MNDIDISLEKANFNMVDRDNDLELIRWGSFNGKDGISKIAAFRISLLDAHFAHQNKVDIIKISSDVVTLPEVQGGAPQQAYEWDGSDFVSVDVKQQKWFKFY
jgi:hypothetical protein